MHGFPSSVMILCSVSIMNNAENNVKAFVFYCVFVIDFAAIFVVYWRKQYKERVLLEMGNWEFGILVTSAVLSFIAILLSIFSFKYNKNKGKIEAAIELAKFYETLITDISPISYVLQRHPQLYSLINSVDPLAMNRFDQNEFEDIFNPEDMDILKEHFQLFDFDPDIIEEVYLLFGRTLPDSVTDKGIESEKRNLRIRRFFRSESIHLLNKLEYFSMAFVHNVAEDDVVYQSLHQSFIKTVKLLYALIALRNEPPYDKFYINTIDLFLSWRKRQEADKDKYIKLKEKVQAADPRPKPKLRK